MLKKTTFKNCCCQENGFNFTLKAWERGFLFFYTVMCHQSVMFAGGDFVIISLCGTPGSFSLPHILLLHVVVSYISQDGLWKVPENNVFHPAVGKRNNIVSNFPILFLTIKFYVHNRESVDYDLKQGCYWWWLLWLWCKTVAREDA